MGLFTKRKDNLKVIEKCNGRQVNYVTRRVCENGSVKDMIVGKSGRIALHDGVLKIICGTDSVFECSKQDVVCNLLMSGNGVTVEGVNTITGEKDSIIVYFAKF